MKYKNSHITYVYLLRDTTSGVIFSLAHDDTPTDYTDIEDTELLGVGTIHWGATPDD